jgi:hypothetical protein
MIVEHSQPTQSGNYYLQVATWNKLLLFKNGAIRNFMKLSKLAYGSSLGSSLQSYSGALNLDWDTSYPD